MSRHENKKPVYQDGFGRVHNSLFRPGQNTRLNACVGRNGGPAGFDRYAGGYFEAGKRLVKSLQEDPWDVDSLIYPLVMVYRHGIETALKHLGKILPFVCDETAEVKLTHTLMDNWKVVRRCMEKLGEAPDGLSQIESKLKELLQIDPSGATFRYPEAKNRTPHLQDTSLINAEVFGEEMAFLAQFFEGSCYWADHLLEQKCEAIQDQRAMEREMVDYYG